MIGRLCCIVALVLVLQGCGGTLEEEWIREAYVRQRWLPALDEGKTRKQEVIDALGVPSESYAGGTILAYRLLLVPDAQISEKACSAIHSPEPMFVNRRRREIPEKGTLIVVRDNMAERWHIFCAEAEYHLVLVFEPPGTLKKCRFSRAFPP